MKQKPPSPMEYAVLDVVLKELRRMMKGPSRAIEMHLTIDPSARGIELYVFSRRQGIRTKASGNGSLLPQMLGARAASRI